MSNARELAQIPSTPSGRRNLIINGAMTVDQRNNGGLVTAHSSYPLDRFRVSDNLGGTFEAQRSTESPDDFTNSLLFKVKSTDTSLAAAEYAGFITRLEGQDIAHLNFGSSAAKTVTLSFWCKFSVTGTYGGCLNNGNDRAYPFSYTVNAADTWERKIITISGDTSGTWATDNSIGFELWLLSIAGSNFGNESAGAWVGTYEIAPTGVTNPFATDESTYYFTGVQLEVGSVATEFEHRSFGEELALCQRYYQKSYAYGTAPGSVTTAGWIGSTLRLSDQQTGYVEGDPRFEQRMRTSPTITFYDRNGTVNRVNYYIGGSSIANYTMTVTNSIDTGFSFYTDTTTTKGGVRFAYTADAEL